MNLEELNNLDLNNPAALPLPARIFLLLLTFGMVVTLGYFLLLVPALDDLESEKVKEASLKTVFLDKKKQAINLEVYKQQMIEIESAFGALLKQLPDRSQIDGLLTDINQSGLERGLSFELFKPNKEIISEFYAEMPIAIEVTGHYKDLGDFATSVSRLSRIVTLDNISIESIEKDKKSSLPKDALRMKATARTYRYLDESELASKPKEAKG